MVDEPRGDNQGANSEQFLNVRVQGRIILTQEAVSAEKAVESAPPENNCFKDSRWGRFWRIVTWPIRWIFRQTNQYPDFVTASATFWIAIFTIVLAWTSIRQGSESSKEFRAVQRARMVFSAQSGQIIELKRFGNTTKLVLYLRNDGHSPAHDVATTAAVVTPPMGKVANFPYKALYPASNQFVVGPTIGEGEPLTSYTDFDSKTATEIMNGTIALRVVGRITYWDDFGSYCEPFGAIYFTDPPRFDPIFLPPQHAVCDDSNTTDSENFSVSDVNKGIGTVQFFLRSTEPISPSQPRP